MGGDDCRIFHLGDRKNDEVMVVKQMMRLISELWRRGKS